MNKAPLASIIITSYNYGRFLADAIDSALNQTYPNKEVIVVDDGSIDHSPEIISSYGNQIVPILKENRGQASALNMGFRASRGEIICFVDSDDCLLPNAIEHAMVLFSDMEVVKVHWPLWVIDERGRKSGQVVPTAGLPEGNLREVALRGGPGSYIWPPTAGNAWARHFLQKIFPIPEDEFVISPDLYLSAFAPVFGPLRRLLEPQGCYRRHAHNSSQRESFEERLRRWEHTFRILGDSCRALGIGVDAEGWRSSSWWHRTDLSRQEMEALIPPASRFILIDDDALGLEKDIAGRHCLPFLERDGRYWGSPPDDATAVREFERLRQSGAEFLVFSWPAFWWLDYYPRFRDHVRSGYRCIQKNDRLLVFDLRRRLQGDGHSG
jgi:glycosyltransferase involved in cell wall biosynthesis